MSDNVMDLKEASSFELAREAVKVLLENKGHSVTLFHVSDITSVTDYYINVTGGSSTQVGALADILDEKLSERGRSPLRIEGRSANSWLLVDYGDVIVNVFDRESRSFYDLDRLFPETARRDIDAMICEVDKKFELETKI